ncbi:MAG: hypothetical protein HWE34_15115, partial [Methylocystaceae bacterium]|nr:hypothetical protein [Methylocystaceae bacterium]
MPFGRRILRWFLHSWKTTLLLVSLVYLATYFLGERCLFQFAAFESSHDHSVLSDLNLYLLSTQAAIVSVIYAISIALITIVYQNNPARNTWVNVFFAETEVRALSFLGLLFIGFTALEGFWLDRVNAETFTVMTFLNVVWFVANIFGCGFFLYKAAKFLLPSQRVGLLKSYTANDLWLSETKEVLKDHYWQNSCELGYLPKGKDGVDFWLGRHWFDRGEIAVSRTFSRGKKLVDVRLWLLRPVFKSLLKQEGNPNYIPDDEFTHNELTPNYIIFPVSVGEVYPENGDVNEQIELCNISRKDNKPTCVIEWKEFFIKNAFVFKNEEWHPHKSSCATMLSDLAEVCIDAIKRDNEADFKEARKTLIDQLEFLLALSVTESTNDEIWNVMVINDDWMYSLRTLMRITTEKIHQNPFYAERMMSGISNLLWSVGPKLNMRSYQTVMWLPSYMIYVLNLDWSHRQMKYMSNSGNPLSGIWLPQPDRSDFYGALRGLIGQWEHLTRTIHTRRGGPQLATEWDWRSRESCLRTVYLERNGQFIVESVQVGNIDGANWSIDTFLQFIDRISLEMDDNYYLSPNESNEINTALIQDRDHYQRWYHDNKEKHYLTHYDSDDIADGVAYYAFCNRWVDTALATILVLIDWTLYPKPDRDVDFENDHVLSIEAVKRIVHLIPEDKKDVRINYRSVPMTGGVLFSEPREIFNCLLRIFATGNRWSESSYYAEISKYIEKLCQMQETDRVTGRVYSGYGGDLDVEAFKGSIGVLLLCSIPDKPDEYYQVLPEQWVIEHAGEN